MNTKLSVSCPLPREKKENKKSEIARRDSPAAFFVGMNTTLCHLLLFPVKRSIYDLCPPQPCMSSLRMLLNPSVLTLLIWRNVQKLIIPSRCSSLTGKKGAVEHLAAIFHSAPVFCEIFFKNISLSRPWGILCNFSSCSGYAND